MTTVTAEQRLTIVKHLAAGKDLDWVAAATRFDRSVVLDIASRHGYPDQSKLAWARDVLAEKAQQPAPAQTPAPAVAAPAVTRPAPGGTPQQQQPTVGALIAAGRASGSKRITAQAERVAAGITKLGDMLAAERAKIEARREREQAKVEARREREAAAARAREEVLRLEKELAAAREKLRGQPQPHRRPPRPGTHMCTIEGCDRTFDTSQGRSLHERRAHQGAES